MRKTMKKLVAIATTAVMTLAMGVSAFAADDIITVAGTMNDWNTTDMSTQFKDEDGDGIFTTVMNVPAGEHGFKILVNGVWTPDGMGNDYGITVAADTEVTFYYNPASTNKYPFTAAGEGVTVNTDHNRESSDTPDDVKADLDAAVADAATWMPTTDAPAEDETEAPAEDETEAPAEDETTVATSDDKETTPVTGDAVSTSILLIGAVAVVAFVASKKRVNA